MSPQDQFTSMKLKFDIEMLYRPFLVSASAA